MIPLVDIHCHLLAGLDDGPRTPEEAVAMCCSAYAEGIRLAAATAHQNERWPDVTPARIRQACQDLSGRLREIGIPLTVFPSAEVMVQLDLASAWANGDLVSVADRGQYLLLEMPHGCCLDLRGILAQLGQTGLRVILAHPERHAELLHEGGRIEQLIAAGCLVQISATSVTDPPSWRDRRAIKSWLKRGVVHLVGSDGHNPTRRPPALAAAYRQIARWAGNAVADRVCSTHGMACLQGLPFRVPAPVAEARRWLL